MPSIYTVVVPRKGSPNVRPVGPTAHLPRLLADTRARAAACHGEAFVVGWELREAPLEKIRALWEAREREAYLDKVEP